MEDGLFAQHKMSQAMFRWNQHLSAVFFGKDKGLPLLELGRCFISIDNHQVDSPQQAGDQVPGQTIAMETAKHVPFGNGDAVSHKLCRHARFCVELLVVELHVMPAKIFEYRRRRDEANVVELEVSDWTTPV